MLLPGCLKKKCNGLILISSFIVSGSYMLGIFLCYLTGLVSGLGVGTCGLNDSADLKCHTLLSWPAHSISLTSKKKLAALEVEER